MGVAQFEEEAPFDHRVVPLAAVLTRTPHGNLHAGLLYRGENGERCALHLGWQDKLYDRWDFQVLWAAPDAEPELLALAAGHCRLVWAEYQKTRSFPYAFEDRGASFDAEGRLVLSDGAHGMTCATIIVGIFHRAGIVLVQRDTWPIRKELDLKFLESVRNFTPPQHFELLRGEVEAGVQRLHPDEAVAACACELPAAFPAVRSESDALVTRLDGRRRTG